MEQHCIHNIPETKKGTGPCDIRYEVKKRNGKPNWWCRTHGYEASAPDGGALKECHATWFKAPPDEMRRAVDLAQGEFAAWGALPPAIEIGDVPHEEGGVHIHFREDSTGEKTIDDSYDIVEVRFGDCIEVIEAMAAKARSISELMGKEVAPLACRHCGELHIDELKFATQPHRKHQCNGCGRNFWDRSPSISNPLGGLRDRLGLPAPPEPRRVERLLRIQSADYAAIAMWPSNRAIVSTMSRPEDEGIHVHAWVRRESGLKLVLDETYSPVVLDGMMIDECALRMLSVQRALAANSEVPIVSLNCTGCSRPILSPTEGWVEPVTQHRCGSCGTENRTRLKSFVNPLAGLGVR